MVDLTIVSLGAWTAGTVTVFEPDAGSEAPCGPFPLTDAVFIMEPPSRSDCFASLVPVQVVDSPGFREVCAQTINPAIGSVTVTDVTVTLPVLVTTKEYGIASLVAVNEALAVDLTTDRRGVWTPFTVTVFDATGVIVEPLGAVPATLAVFTTEPLLRSARVAVREAVHDMVAPGASVVTGHTISATFGSVITIDDMVTFPVFSTTNVYEITSPTRE